MISSHDLEHLQQLKELRIELFSTPLHHALLARQNIIRSLLKRQVDVRNILFLLVLHFEYMTSLVSAASLPSGVAKMLGTIFATRAENARTTQISPWIL